MALIWMKSVDGCRYEVKKAGESVRLYTDGVFHSQWNPNSPIGGQLWDLLFLPALYLESYPQVDRCLILGVGGGAVINAMQHFTKVNRVVAVDLDPQHLYIAKKYFLSNTKGIELVQDDAVKYVEAYKGRKFDFIVEDLFVGSQEKSADARRPIEVNVEWLKVLQSKLSSQGLLVINFEDVVQAKKALRPKILAAAGFVDRRLLSHPGYENIIAVCFKEKHSKKTFDQNMQLLENTFGHAVASKLQYEII